MSRLPSMTYREVVRRLASLQLRERGPANSGRHRMEAGLTVEEFLGSGEA